MSVGQVDTFWFSGRVESPAVCAVPSVIGAVLHGQMSVGQVDTLWQFCSMCCTVIVFCIEYILLSQWEFIPWEIPVAFPKENQLQESRTTQP